MFVVNAFDSPEQTISTKKLGEARHTIDSESNYSFFPLLSIAEEKRQIEKEVTAKIQFSAGEMMDNSTRGKARSGRQKSLNCKKWFTKSQEN